MQQEISHNDYKIILKEELASRCRQNPRYSLRAFARDLKLAPSRLSEILSGKQGLSRPAAEKVAKALGYAPSEAQRFCDLVEALHARSKKNRDQAKLRLKRLEVPSETVLLQHDTIKTIADWYHFAILELTNLDDFKGDSKWIAKKLGISEFETQLALDRLQRLNLIVRKDDDIRLNQQHGFVPNDVPSDGVKTFHTQLMGKAREALQMQPLDEREFHSEIVAIDKKKLPEAKKMIRDFRNSFCTNMEEGAAKDGLYCLAVQFFDLGKRG